MASRARSERETVWLGADGAPLSCEEKLRVLDENLAEIRQVCQDAFEDALLMGCDEARVRQVFATVIENLHNPQGPDTAANRPHRDDDQG
ncbi:MAG: hypothetical protein EA405_02720 [Rhodospirillales bacterium]|nr:MAG: hypothetical protein EA405_02720 [Rhodospirillales bacterium]